MNQPLKHRGFRLFQSSYVRDGGREASIFSVSYDPGVSVVYTGFIIFIFGLIAIFYLKPLIRRAYARPLPGPRPIVRPVPVERTSS
jgi:cytochrome c biogenesis protein ResB